MEYTDLKRYHYTLPQEQVRMVPVEPRDSARLLVYERQTDTITFTTFRHLAHFVPSSATLVLNESRVFPARLWLKKATGGKIEVLVLVNEWDGGNSIPVLVDRRVSIGDELLFPNGDTLLVTRQQERRFFVTIHGATNLFSLLDMFGNTPLPHYLESKEGLPEESLRKRYQTIFARGGASVAAPTASLHFTNQVFTDLQEKGIALERITLDVGLGTFAPLSEENFRTHKLHPERVTLSKETAYHLNTVRVLSQPVIAVGTTVTRALETTYSHGEFQAFSGWIDTFIYPPHHFRSLNGLLTNFHLPETSLMLLVDAFLQDGKSKRGLKELYERAIEEGFMFYSFGDSMLIL